MWGVKPSRRSTAESAASVLRPSTVFLLAAVAVAITVGLTADCTESLAVVGCDFEAGVDLLGTSFPKQQLALSGCHFRGDADLSDHSSQGLGMQKCQFDSDLVLRGGTCTGLMIFESDFHGAFDTEGLEVRTGLLVGCSVRTPPDRHTEDGPRRRHAGSGPVPPQHRRSLRCPARSGTVTTNFERRAALAPGR